MRENLTKFGLHASNKNKYTEQRMNEWMRENMTKFGLYASNKNKYT